MSWLCMESEGKETTIIGEDSRVRYGRVGSGAGLGGGQEGPGSREA